MGAQEDIVAGWIQDAKKEMEEMRYTINKLTDRYTEEYGKRVVLEQLVEKQKDQIFEMDKELHPCPEGYYKFETGGVCIPDPHYIDPRSQRPTPQE